MILGWVHLTNSSNSWKDKIESALLFLETLRFVHSLKISSFENISESCTQTYTNLGENSLDVIHLLPRKRVTQRSLKVFSQSGSRQAVLPSYMVHEALIGLSEDYLAGIFDNLENNEEMEEKTFELRCLFRRIFKYGKNEEEIDRANQLFDNISQHIESLDPVPRRECEELLSRLIYLVNVQKYYYLPFVELGESLGSAKHCVIIYTVETLGYLKMRNFSFYMKGEIRPSFGLKPAFVQSYHLETISPKGLDIYDFEFNNLEGTNLIRNKSEKTNYFDKELFYVSFSPDETKEIRERIDEKKFPTVTLSMRINRLLFCLFFLVHIAILSPLLVKALFGHVELSQFIASLALAATIFVSASIYSMDKKIVLEFALMHLLITCTLLVIELGILMLI